MAVAITARTSFSLLFPEMLAEFGVRHIFGNPGTTEMPLMDALADVPADGANDQIPPNPCRERATIIVSSDQRGDIAVCVSDPAVNTRLRDGHTHRVIHRDRDLANQLQSFWIEVRDANMVA